jgi:hypothetical protein
MSAMDRSPQTQSRRSRAPLAYRAHVEGPMARYKCYVAFGVTRRGRLFLLGSARSRSRSLMRLALSWSNGARDTYTPSTQPSTLHGTPRDTSGRHATPRDTLWLMLLNFPNGVMG